MAHARSQEAPPVPGEFGPNDHHWENGTLKPGLGPDHRPRSQMRAGTIMPDEPPEKSELRRQAAALKAVERQQMDKAAELEQREAELAEREAALASALSEAGLGDGGKKGQK